MSNAQGRGIFVEKRKAMLQKLILLFPIVLLYSCHQLNPNTLKPDFITDPTPADADDPAIWINFDDPMQSLILGTDKGDLNGGIYVFDLQGNMIKEKSIGNLPRPNNIDVEYGMVINGDTMDIAVFTLRNDDKIRVLRLPEMEFIDNGGIEVFKGAFDRSPIGHCFV